MYTAIISTVLFILFVFSVKIIIENKDKIDFYLTGIDDGFKISEIHLLYKVAVESELEEPKALFISVPALNRSIASILKNAKIRRTENTPMVQNFLTKLYRYRTKVELDPKNSNSLKSTRGLKPGQKIKVLLKGTGVFSSSVINSGRELVIALPRLKNMIPFSGKDWIGKKVSIYLQRTGDAGYVFDTEVHNSVQYASRNALYVGHTDNIMRFQKRKSVRTTCNLKAMLYLPSIEMATHIEPESFPGLRCLIEDISEEGALIRIGGIGRKDIAVKLQFELGIRLIVMYGIVKGIEYNQELNQSRMHFSCMEISPESKNAILSYVYNVMPKEEREEIEAISQTVEESKEEEAAIVEAAAMSKKDGESVSGVEPAAVIKSAEDGQYVSQKVVVPMESAVLDDVEIPEAVVPEEMSDAV